MDTLNLTALLRPSLPSNAHLHASSEGDGDGASRASSTASLNDGAAGVALTTTSTTVADASSHVAKAAHTSSSTTTTTVAAPWPSVSCEGGGAGGGSGGGAAVLEDDVPYPLRVHHRPSSDDSVSLRSYWEALFYPEVYTPIFKSLRIVLLVALPMALLTRLPSVNYRFPAHVVMPLWAIVDCRFTVGEQLATLIVSMQCATWIMVFGAMLNSWGMVHANSAWWCVLLTTSFLMHLFGDVRCKRVVMLQSIIIMMMEHLPGGTGILFPVLVGRDMLLSTSVAAFQCLFPPRSVATECDALLAQGWAHCRQMMHEAMFAFWSDDPIAVALALNRVTSEPMQRIFAVLPGRLFFVMYEFWESTLRLELRRERLQLMQRLMPPLLALTDAARAVAMQKSLRSEQLRSRRQARQPHTSPSSQQQQQQQQRHDSGSDGVRTQYNSPTEPTAELLRGSDGAAATPTTASPTQPQPTSLTSRTQPQTYLFTADDRAYWQQAGAILRPALERYMHSIDDVFDALGRHLDPADTAAHVPFDALQAALDDVHAALSRLNADMVIKSDRVADAELYTYTLFFHLMLVPIARRLVAYGASMRQFDRRRYKSQWQRTAEFFVLDYWRGFWDELPRRLQLATPRDVRLFKDALKLSLAYGVGVMFTIYIDRDNVYYFGMAILMAVGLPTAGDTMVASVYRVTGMLCSCSLAYIAVWHTSSMAGEIALALCGIFLSLLVIDSVPYNHIGQYCAMLLITSLNSASSKLQLLARILCNCLTMMTYYAIVVFIFPINVHDVTLSHNVEALVAIVNGFSDVVYLILQDMDALIDRSGGDSQERLQMGLQRSLATCASTWAKLAQLGQWIPKAAAEPAARGMPYPMETMRSMYSSMRRLASATEMIALMLWQLADARLQPDRHRDVLSILAAVAPVLRQIEARNRAVVRSLILAMTQPHTWSLADATSQFASFLQLRTMLQRCLFNAHMCTIQALRREYADRVFNRTIVFVARDAALSRQPTVDVSVQQVTQKLVPALQPWHHGAPPHGGSNDTTTTVTTTTSTHDVDKPNMSSHDKTSGHSSANGSSSGSSNNNSNNDGSKKAADGDDDVTAFAAAGSDDGNDATDGTDAALNARLHAISQQAEQQVYSETVARRNSTIVGGSVGEGVRMPYEFAYDANVTLCIAVATDIFFIEAERLLKTAMVMNQYACSREPRRGKHKTT